MCKSQFTEEQISRILRLAEADQKVGAGARWAACYEHGTSEGTYYRWKAQFGGLDVSQLRRLRRLEEENRKLKQIVADLTLDNVVLKDIASKNW